MTKIQEEVMESAQLTDAQERAIKEESQGNDAGHKDDDQTVGVVAD